MTNEDQDKLNKLRDDRNKLWLLTKNNEEAISKLVNNCDHKWEDGTSALEAKRSGWQIGYMVPQQCCICLKDF